MTRTNLTFAAAALVLLATTTAARAQAPGVPGAGRPVFSPYLNLLRRDASPGVNFYGLVRPQIVAQGAIQSLQQQVNAATRLAASQQAMTTELPVTGLPATFMNTGGYFLNNQFGAGPAAGLTTTRNRPTAPATNRPAARGR